MSEISDLADTAYRNFEIVDVPSTGKHKPEKEEIRALFDVVEGNIDASAGRERAILVTPYRTLVSEPIVSPMLPIVSVFQTPAGTTITVRTRNPHGLETANVVNIRINGWHGITKRQHPGHGQFTITVVDSLRFILDASVWAAGSKFISGMVWRDAQIDARPALSAMLASVEPDGGGQLSLPTGVMAFLTNEAFPYCITLPKGVEVIGRGRTISHWFMGDGLDAHLVLIGGDDTTLRKLSLHHNRQENISSRHCIRIVEVDEVVDNGLVAEVGVLGGCGYGIGAGNEGSCTNIEIRDGVINGCYADGADFKNRKDLNVGNSFKGMKVKNYALGSVGVDHDPITLGNNPIATTNLSSSVVVTNLGHDYIPLATVTFTGAAVVNGININGSWTIVSKTGTTYTINVSPQVATGTGSGGGPAVLEYAAVEMNGKTGLDCRGKGWMVTDIEVETNLANHTGVRLRGGLVGDHNGQGGWYSSLKGITVEHIGATAKQGTAVSVSGQHNSVVGVTAKNCQYGVSIGRSGAHNAISAVAGDTCETTVYCDGDENVITGCTATSNTDSFVADGGTIPENFDLPDNAFTTVMSSSTVTVKILSHGITASTGITFGSVDSINGVKVNGDQTILAVVDVDNLTFVSGDVASASGTGGGIDGVYSLTDAVNNARDNIFVGCISKSATASGFRSKTNSIATTFTGCKTIGDAIIFTNGGTGTRISGGNLIEGVTVSLLPAASGMAIGTRGSVTNANSTTFMATVAAGGSNIVPVINNGTAWKIG